MKPYKRNQPKPYKKGKESLYFGLNGLSQEVIPEIKVRYNRGKQFLGQITKSEDAASFLRKLYDQGKIQMQESFVVIYLNRKNDILGYYKHSIGGITETIVDIRIIFATALKTMATSMVLSHNHPSGSLKPSKSDLNLTSRIKETGKLLEISIVDHIILSKEGYYSFADHHQL